MTDRDYQLIIGYLEGTLADHDVQELLHKVKSDPAFAESFQEIARLWDLPERKLAEPDLTAERALRKWYQQQLPQTTAKPEPQPLFRKINYSWMAAAAVVLLVGMVAYLFFNSQHTSLPKEMHYAVQHTVAGQRKQITLPDGSLVWINSATKLAIPDDYGKKNRVLQLEGEAWFEVKKDREKPFIVNAAGVKTCVLGTTFNISAYKDGNEVSISLVSGKVQVDIGDDITKRQILEPGRQLRYNRKNNRVELTDFVTEEAIGWKNNTLVFNYERWPDVAKKISRWYNIEVHLEGTELNEQLFKGSFENLSLVEVMEQISHITEISYKIEGHHLYIKSTANH